MEKEKVCSGGHCGGSGCCGGTNGCSYGSHGMHSVLRLFAVLLVMILIFHLGMQVGELRTQYSNRGGYEMRFDKGYRNGPMMQYQQAPAPSPTQIEESAQ
ncbi:MAG TPA: hypothetical protein VJB09_02215 [Candidatus Paceibacterota bacterium]